MIKVVSFITSVSLTTAFCSYDLPSRSDAVEQSKSAVASFLKEKCGRSAKVTKVSISFADADHYHLYHDVDIGNSVAGGVSTFVYPSIRILFYQIINVDIVGSSLPGCRRG